MAIKTQVNAILNTKMDRQGFIKHVAVGVIALSGVGSALRLMSPSGQQNSTPASGGYGSSAYGGGQAQK